MKKSALVGWTCLALAGWFSYVKFEDGDPTFAVITGLCALLFAGVSIILWWLNARAMEELSWFAGPPRIEPPMPPPATPANVTPKMPSRKERLKAQNVPPARLRAEQVNANFAALQNAGDTAQREPVLIALAEGRRLEVVVTRNLSGLVSIKITAHGFDVGQFNTRVYKRLQRVDGSEWKEASITAQQPLVIETTGAMSSVVQARALWAIARLW